jgi:copper transport protein
VPYLVRQAVATLMTIVLALVLATPAFAHAALVSSDPANGAVLNASPQAIDLTFSEPVSPLAASLVAPDGTAGPLTGFSSSGSVLTIAIPPDDRAGTRVVSWRVVSDDGHPVAGALVFSVGSVSGAAPIAPSTDRFASFALWLARAITFIALFVGVGGTGFRVIAPLPGPAGLVCAIILPIGLLSTFATIGLQGLDALGQGLPGLAQPGIWSVGFASAYGTTSAVEGVALLVAMLSLLMRGRRAATALAAVAIVLTALGISLSGHAAAADPQWLTRTAVFVHIACIVWWVGGLFPLAVVLKQGRRFSARPLIRFSRLIPFAIGPLVVSGTVLAVIQLGWPGPAWLTAYGLILAAKLLLLAVLFSIASWNRWVLTAPAARGDLVSRTHMQGTIAVELFLIFAVLGLVSGWRFTPPPRALALAEATRAEATQAASLEAHLTGQEGIAADATLTPRPAGTFAAQIVLSQDGAPLAAKGVVVALSQPALGIEPVKTMATLSPDGVWTASEIFVPVAGMWTLELQIRVSDFKLARLKTEVHIAP